MPHRPVIRETNVTTKIRLVFDASAPAYIGLSLNDSLESGPNLLPDLVRILLIFGNCSSPFLLKATISHHLVSLESSFAVQKLSHNLYVDDLLSRADSDQGLRSSGLWLGRRGIYCHAGSWHDWQMVVKQQGCWWVVDQGIYWQEFDGWNFSEGAGHQVVCCWGQFHVWWGAGSWGPLCYKASCA